MLCSVLPYCASPRYCRSINYIISSEYHTMPQPRRG